MHSYSSHKSQLKGDVSPVIHLYQYKHMDRSYHGLWVVNSQMT